MAVQRDQPYGSFRFRVGLGGRARASEGFSEVRLPRFLLRPAVAAGREAGRDASSNDSVGGADHLVLRRGFSGGLDLYAWWDQERQSKRSRGRIVTVELLEESSHEPVTAWRFTGCRPVALEYSPLNALESAVVVETIVLSFDHVEMS